MRWYVYRLIDPRDGEPFYIGKGCGRRMRQHLGKAAAPNVKFRVDAIRKSGAEPVAEEIAYFYEEADALQFESRLIRSTKGLVNIARNPVKPKVFTLIETAIELVSAYSKLRSGAKCIDQQYISRLVARLQFFRGKAIGLPHEETYLLLIDGLSTLPLKPSN